MGGDNEDTDMGGDNEDTEASLMNEDGDSEDNWDDEDDGDDNWGDVAVDDDNWGKDETGVNNLDDDDANNWDDCSHYKVEEPPSKSYFEQSYLCYPISHLGKSEDGNRIIMPQSALDELASLRIQFPMMFEIKSHFHGEPVSCCSVLEFTAEEGFVFMPSWMMKNLQLEALQLVKLKSTRLSKGTYLKLQPHKTEFIMLKNPKDILETALINFACLSKGDTIMISHNMNDYFFDVLETEPGNSISVVETDCILDFEEPLDYKKLQESEKRNLELAANKAFLDKEKEKCSNQQAIYQDKETTKFKAFTGKSRRLG